MASETSLDDLNKYAIDYTQIYFNEIANDNDNVNNDNNTGINNSATDNIANASTSYYSNFMKRDNDNIDNLLDEWRVYCETNGKMHIAACAFYRILNNCIIITSILLSSIASILSLSIISQDNNKLSNDITLLLIFNSINILSTAIITIHRLLNFQESQHLHDIYSDMFVCTAKDIQMHMILCNSESSVFASKSELIKQIKHDLDILIDKSPIVPSYIQKHVLKKMPLLQQ
jgi:hypothetical protein